MIDSVIIHCLAEKEKVGGGARCREERCMRKEGKEGEREEGRRKEMGGKEEGIHL